ncbi:MAG: hypothetical protein Q9219_003778 [cf. Caloplaca sp. 3 TL-2023]
MAMQLSTIGFPIWQIMRSARESSGTSTRIHRRRFYTSIDSPELGRSLASVSARSERSGKMYPMESLNRCLRGNHNSLQVYASCVEFNGENVMFLTKVISFKEVYSRSLRAMGQVSRGLDGIRMGMFRQALEIFVTLVHSGTASYPINIESSIYNRLVAIFGPATELVAACNTDSSTTSFSNASTSVTPWDEPNYSQDTLPSISNAEGSQSYPMRTLRNDYNPDSLQHVEIPTLFDENVFDAAFESIQYMVWSQVWQRYMGRKEEVRHESV